MDKRGLRPKISTLLIALLLVSLFAVSFTLLISDISGNYNTAFDNTTYSGFNKLTVLRTQTQALQNKTLQASTPTGVLDVIGAFFTAGYNVMKTAVTSMDVAQDIAQEGISKIDLGAIGGHVYVTAILIIAILFIIGIIISAIVKREM